MKIIPRSGMEIKRCPVCFRQWERPEGSKLNCPRCAAAPAVDSRIMHLLGLEASQDSDDEDQGQGEQQPPALVH